MKIEIVDRDTFASIKPEAILRYLNNNGWSEVRRVEGELVIYRKQNTLEKTALVWMPVGDEYPDYVPMISRLMKTVSDTEGKSELQLLDDLETVAVGDIIRLGTYDPLYVHDFTLPLFDGIDLLASAHHLASAAAASVVNKRPVHPRRPPFEATQFVRNLRMAQTERGSYLIRLISPINQEPSQIEGELVGMPREQPFSRKAVIELVKGLSALHQAAEDNKDRGRFFFNTFLQAVPAGVSANLCEALVSSNEQRTFSRPIEISVTWSYAIPQTENLPTRAIRFDASIAPFIRQAAKEFRAKNPEIVTLNGWINILERERGSDTGLIRLYTRLDDRMRAVRIQLPTDTYDLAIDAHKRGSLVSVTGTLVIQNTTFYRLDNPTDFHVIEQEGLFDLDQFTPTE